VEKPTFLVALLLVSTGAAAAGCGSSSLPSATARPNDTLFQYSSLQTLMAGVYDGELTVGELKTHGGFGLGTFNTLDGEMVVLDGTVYQVKTDGAAYVVADSQKIPFAEVTDFEPDQTVEIDKALDCAGMQSYLDAQLPSLNVPYAIEITGTFEQLETRSVPAQTRPYPPLADVVKEQTTFDFTNVSGTMVGFRLPSYLGGVGAAGYHLHFLTSDRRAGGHVLSCQMSNVKAEVDLTGELEVALPSDSDFYHVDLSTPTPVSNNTTE
jgi:acetolactate decarboxylase